MTPEEISRWLANHTAGEGYPDSICGSVETVDSDEVVTLYVCGRSGGHAGSHSVQQGRRQWRRDDTPSMEELAAYPLAVEDCSEPTL